MSCGSVSLRRPVLPSRLRFALAVMLGAYPLITVLFVLIGPHVADWPMAARPLPILPFMVFGMVYGVIPLVHRLAGGWIARGASGTSVTPPSPRGA